MNGDATRALSEACTATLEAARRRAVRWATNTTNPSLEAMRVAVEKVPPVAGLADGPA